MSKTTHTHEHPSPEPKKHGCCGESHAKDEKAQPATHQKASPAGSSEREHSNHSDGDSGGAGGEKARK